MQSWKLCQKLCSLRLLKPNRKYVRNFNPVGQKIFNISFWTEQINDNNLFLNVEIASEFLMLLSKLNQYHRHFQSQTFYFLSRHQFTTLVLIITVLGLNLTSTCRVLNLSSKISQKISQQIFFTHPGIINILIGQHC